MNEEIKVVFGQRLKELRQELNLTQKEFADKVELSNQAICNYEKGDKNPQLDIVYKIAETFNVSIDWLCGRVEEKEVSFSGIESMEFKTYSDIIKCLLKFPNLRIKEDIVWGISHTLDEPSQEERKTRKVYTLLFENEELQKELYQIKYISDLDSNIIKEKDKQKLINAYLDDDFNELISKKDFERFIDCEFAPYKDNWHNANYDEFLQTYEPTTKLEKPHVYNLFYLPF